MKKYFLSLIMFGVFFLSFPSIAHLQVNTNYWKLTSGTIQPNVSSWTLTLPYLTNKNCLGTSNTGLIQTGTCSSGSSFGQDFNFIQGTPNYLIGTTTPLGIILTASSTIGDGTTAGGLTISGGATTTGNAYFFGNTAFGRTDPNNIIDANFGTTSVADLTSINSPFIGAGPYVNYALQTEDFSNASWIKGNENTVTANTANDPRGVLSAEQILGTASDGNVKETISTGGVTGSWTLSLYLKAQNSTGAGTAQIAVGFGTGSATTTATSTTLTLSSLWKRYAFTVTNSSGSNTLADITIQNGTVNIAAWGVQFEPKPFPGPYSNAQTTSQVTTPTINAHISSNLVIAGSLSGATTGGFAGTITNTITALASSTLDTANGLLLTNTTAATAAASAQEPARVKFQGSVFVGAAKNLYSYIQLAPAAGNFLSTSTLQFGMSLAGLGTTTPLAIGFTNVGIGSTTPTAKLSVHLNANEYNPYPLAFLIGSSTSNSTTTLFQVDNVGLASTTNVQVSGLGGSGTRCVDVTAAGLLSAMSGDCAAAGNTFGKTWEINANGALAPTTTVGIMVSASSTIGDGTTGGGLTISGSATSTGIFNFASSTGAFTPSLVFANKPTTSTNFENATLGWTGNTFTIQTQNGGTGTNRALVLSSLNSTGGTVSTLTLTTPNVAGAVPFAWNTSSNSNGTQVAFTTAGTGSSLGGLSASSGTQNFFTINPALNQSSTAAFKALRIVAGEWATGTGAHYLQTWEASTTAVNGTQGTNTEAVFTDAGLFGLGSTSPYAKLSIQGNNGDLATTLLQVSTSTLTGTTTLLTILANGFSGFGIDNPTHVLDIFGSTASTYIFASSTATPNNGFSVSNVTTTFTRPTTNSGDLVLIKSPDNTLSRAALHVQGNNGATEALFVASNGAVGFGTTTPVDPIDIAVTGPSNWIRLERNATRIWAIGAGNGNFNVINSGTNGVSSLSTDFTVAGNNDVGIGSSTPIAKLSVFGINGDTNRFLFDISSSSPTFATSTLFAISNIGSTTINTLTSCNGAAQGLITDSSGTINCGVITASAPTLNANSVYGNKTGASGTATSLATSSELFTGTAGQFAFFSATNSLIGTSSLFVNTSTGYIGIASTSPYAALTLGNGIASSSIDVAEYAFGLAGRTATSTSIGIDARTSNNFEIPIGTSATTITLCGFAAGQHILVRVVNPNNTAGALTWAVCSGETLYWAGKTIPSQTTTATDWDYWSFTASQSYSPATSTTNMIISGAQSANF